MLSIPACNGRRPPNAAGNDTFKTGISVVPVPLWSVPSLASVAATTGQLTGSRFSLGIGTGSITSAPYRESFGLPAHPPIALMRDYLITLRGLLAGETGGLHGARQ